ncbi:hypothetical protein DPSP01_005243 [Paraphaeosphaeria sporulosa]|uniref:Uncharacterized protein n=1 Tax=Paraphaeosphaeria sporulosa TaxID=1460663 RepID=A0A177C3K8_9PLEO|nr:uncharacterized protein CC84DRAFT_1179248 [Paraphaeosphaeria sporulosa]OAG02324.1 hypothetical protein CC84DRAFT_1179248 [Paraphaeosphaeria sporulosa]
MSPHPVFCQDRRTALTNRKTIGWRRRNLFRQSQCARDPLKEWKPAPKPAIQPNAHRKLIETLGMEEGLQETNNGNLMVIPQHVEARTAAPTATTLSPEKYRKASFPSTASRPKIVDLRNHDNFNQSIKRNKSYEKTHRRAHWSRSL